VAAHVAAGVAPSRMGKRIEDYLRPPSMKPRRTGKRTWTGSILHIDRFGNIVTNFHMDDFANLELRSFEMVLGPHRISIMAHNYNECGPGEPFLIAGSSGFIEVSVGQASAAKIIGCEAGAVAELLIW
jgi:S-adenosylmethionine hydrolase